MKELEIILSYDLVSDIEEVIISSTDPLRRIYLKYFVFYWVFLVKGGFLWWFCIIQGDEFNILPQLKRILK